MPFVLEMGSVVMSSVEPQAVKREGPTTCISNAGGWRTCAVSHALMHIHYSLTTEAELFEKIFPPPSPMHLHIWHGISVWFSSPEGFFQVLGFFPMKVLS